MNLNAKDCNVDLRLRTLECLWSLCSDSPKIQLYASQLLIPHVCYNLLIVKEQNPLERILAAGVIWSTFEKSKKTLVELGITQRFCTAVNSVSANADHIKTLPLRTLLLQMISKISWAHSDKRDSIIQTLSTLGLFKHVINFRKHTYIRDNQLHQDHTAACIGVLNSICYKRPKEIKIVLNAKGARIIANIFAGTGLLYTIKWRLAGLITSLCSGPADLRRQFITKFLEAGGVNTMLTQLKLEKNYLTMFALFCALVELSSEQKILNDMTRDPQLMKSVLTNIYCACNKQKLKDSYLDALLDRLALLISRSPSVGPTSKFNKLLKAADTLSFT
eukprot:UN29946